MTDDAALARIDAALGAAARRHNWPGLSVGIVRAGCLILARGYGVADLARGDPVTPGTVLRMGSISKTLTAIAVMQLWEQGRFDLDDDVNRYLGGYRVASTAPDAPAVTIRHLLTHTAGIGALRRYTDLLHPQTGAMTRRQGAALPDLRTYYAPTLWARRRPGAFFSYTNHGYATLGQLVADLSGQPFAQYMIDHVFAPLGMRHSDFLRSERVRGRLASAHRSRTRRRVPVADPEIIPGPAGALFSSVEDMALYLAALMQGGRHTHGAVLKPETLHMMMAPRYRRDVRLPAMGFGFMLEEMEGLRLAGHNGAVPWFTSALWVAPEARLGVIAAINTYDEMLPTVALEALRALLAPTATRNVRPQQPAAPLAGHAAPGPGPDPDPGHAASRRTPGAAPLQPAPEQWSALRGHYGPPPGLLTNLRFWGAWGGEVQVVARDGGLTLRPLVPWGPRAGGVRLYPADPPDPLHFYAVIFGRHVPVLFQPGDGEGGDALCIGLLFTLFRRRGPRSLRVWARLAGLCLLLGAAIAVSRRYRHPSRRR